MIHFRIIRWKNFLSTGDNFTEIDLEHARSTLIVGGNGSGKSTLLDALSFALFGKAHRNITKSQLINTINEKDCVVEVEFSTGGHDFKIHRSIKPNKFEIYQNGSMVRQEASSRDYQKFLEQNVLKLNHKSFHQIVVLGSSSFIPFMQLPAGARREVIEDLLDIQIFSRMNSVVKSQLSKLKEDLSDTTYSLDLVTEKIGVQRKYISDIEKINEEQIRDRENKIAQANQEIEKFRTQNADLNDYITTQAATGVDDAINKLSRKREKILEYEAQFKHQISTLVKDAKFYENNFECPVCTQSIDEELKQRKFDEACEKAKELNQALQHATEQSSGLESDIEWFREISRKVTEASRDVRANNERISGLQTEIGDYQTEINNLRSRGGDLGEANTKLEELEISKSDLTERKFEIMDQRRYKEAVAEMLKDTGIKTKIIREYLPPMNMLINKHLQTLDFFVSFTLDENFNESIKSRYRDSFNYASFSEGEKSRIDLALLFTWRQIARMKNSASTNLLILDETFDSSLDYDGVDNLMKILYSLEEGTNTFVISHKGDMLEGKFDRKFEFEKVKNFSMVHESEDI